MGPEFAEPSLTGELLGFYPVNGWVNALHLATGLVALLLARSAPTAWALIGGLLYTGLGLWGILAPDGQLLAYLRVVDPGIKYEEPSLGRVVNHASVRGTGA